MNRFAFRCVVATALSAVLPCLTSPSFAAKKSAALFEQFNATTTRTAPKNWAMQSSAGKTIIEEAPSAKNKSVKLERTSSTGELSASRSFAPISGHLVVEVRVMSPDQSGYKALPSIFASSGLVALQVGFDGGNIVCSDGQTQKIVQSFNVGEWYILRLEINTSTSTYSVYVDAIKQVESAKFQAPAPNIAKMSFAVASDSTSTAYFDDVRVYSHATQIGEPPQPIFDITKYGAVGDGKTDNTKAIQKAIESCAGTGGSVLIPKGKFVSGTITLKSDMTLFLTPEATLVGNTSDESYPRQEIANFPNMAVEGLRKAFIFANGAKNLRIDGGGTIDGSGTIPQWRMNGGESKRPFLLFPVRCDNLSVQNVYLKDAAVWCFVPTECSDVTIRNICIDSRSYGNRDGIDVVDSKSVLIENCTINTDDDSICPKSGIASGVQNLTVRNCNLMGSVRANGIKFGTASYGQLKNATFEDIVLKNCDKAALALEAVDGADISNIKFKRIDITNTNSPIYLIIGTRSRTPKGASRKLGSIDKILFEDITARNLKYNLGCPISGNIIDGKRYPLTNLTFRRCNITFKGGLTSLPKTPPEMGTQYPECNLWGALPAYGYFIRHADNVTFTDCKTNVVGADARKWLETADVINLKN